MLWLHRVIGALLFVLLAPCFVWPVAAAEKRLAVVFANNAYPGALALQATHTDGANVRQALERVGFEVRLVLDANKATMLEELRAFVFRLQAANASKAPGDKVLAFFYFAGHGAQDTLYPGNYVWPTDVQATNSEQLSQSAIKLNDIIDWIAAGEPTSSFLVMDACRNYPFDAEQKGVKKGFLVEERDVPATLIGYAASPGATVVDSNDYSEALAAAIEMPAIDAARAFQEVQIRVAQKTQRQQHPSYYNRLLEIVHLRDGAATSYPMADGRTPGQPSQTTMVTPRPVPPSVPQARTQDAPRTAPAPLPPPSVTTAERTLRFAIPPLKPGTAVVTGFSGSKPGPDGKPIVDSDGSVVHVADLTVRAAEAGSTSGPQQAAGPTARDIGQVFAAAIDPDAGSPDIYLAATSIYGLPVSRNGQPVERGEAGAEWADGLFGARLGGGPGTIWKFIGATQELVRFADIAYGGNSNPGPGLGQLAFDRLTRQLYVSDLSTGLVHRIDLSGRLLTSFDHGQHGRVTGDLNSAAAGRVPLRDLPSSSLFDTRDPETWGFADARRRIWGLALNDNRLYYAVSEGPQIWSVAINPDGAFSTDARLEADLSNTVAARQELPRIEFDAAGDLYIGLLGGITLIDLASPDGRPRASAVMRLRLAPASRQSASERWSQPEPVGHPSADLQPGPGLAFGYGFDAEGRIDVKACGRSLWLTGWDLQQGALSPLLLHAEPPSGGMTKRRLAPLTSPARPIGSVALMAPCPQPEKAPLTASRVPSTAQPPGVPIVSVQGPAMPAEPGQSGDRLGTSGGQGAGGGSGGGITVPTPRITIAKECASCAFGGTCECRITLRNIGLVPVSTPIGFRDPIPRGTDPAPRNMTVISFRPDGTDWSCSGVPGTLACTLPGASLPPLSARTVIVAYAPEPLRSTSALPLAVCAVLRADEAISRAARQREACVELGTDVVVTVTGDERCTTATRCSFEATISNRSRGAFLGSLSYVGALSIAGGPVARADIVAIEPNLPCPDLPGAIPFACSGVTQLAGRETRKLKVTFRVPSASGNARGRVCFVVAEGTTTATPAGRSALVELARSRLPDPRTGGPGRSGMACVEFEALARCPGQLKLRGDRCACIDGQERHGGDQCRVIRASSPPMPVEPPAIRPIPLPILPPMVQPTPPAERVPDRAACERPRMLINGRCEYPMVDCNGRQIAINQPCAPPTKDCYGKQIPIGQACAPPTKDCYGKQIPINQACAAPTKDCYGKQIPINQACAPPTKDCNGRQIPINQACAAPTKDCYGKQIPINQACAPPTKDCYGRQIPIKQACVPPRPTTKDCYGKQIPSSQACLPPRPTTKDCYGKKIPISQACTVARPSTKTCPNGQVVPITRACPSSPPVRIR